MLINNTRCYKLNLLTSSQNQPVIKGKVQVNKTSKKGNQNPRFKLTCKVYIVPGRA